MNFRSFLLCTMLSFSPVSEGQEILRWGADSESGAPYAFKDPANSSKLIGFEVEIIEAIASRLGVKSQFVQNQWDGLIQGLHRKDYDVVINGLEITEDRKDNVLFTLPYYSTHETITVRANESRIQNLVDLADKKVGTLDTSLALRILKTDSPLAKISIYDEELHAFNDLENGRIDAVFLDFPIALYYASFNSKLKIRPQGIGNLEYAIALRLEDVALKEKIDQAIKDLKLSGELQTILARWNLAPAPNASIQATAFHEFLNHRQHSLSKSERLLRYFGFLPALIQGALMTLWISLTSMLLAISVGFTVASARHFGGGGLQFLATSFVELVRGTPLLIQLYLIFYGLPHLGLRLEPFWAAVLGLGLNYGACEAENYRAGIASVAKNQTEAAIALGLSSWQTYFYVTLPQALRLVLPPMTNDFISLLKDSSLVSVITMVELTTVYGQLASTYFDYLGLGLLVALVYFLLGMPFVRLARRFERSAQTRRFKRTNERRS